MKKAIVTTTINAPTAALKKFHAIAGLQDWHLFIVGDQKTPHGDYRTWAGAADHVTYIGPEQQEMCSLPLSELIGWNCIQRRNFGFIAAHRWGAEIIATVDDDNIPLEGWGQDVGKLLGNTLPVLTYNYKEDVPAEQFLFDPLAPTAHGPNVWHRGFPIQMLKKRCRLDKPVKVERTPMVQADLWNGDPDVDAICRIAKQPNITFNVKGIYAGAKPGPFNSQNTFLHRSVLADYFMFPGIGRMDDIWASYWLQAVHPNSVVYGPASVYQDRNEHDLVKDLEAEIIGYKGTQSYAAAILDNRITELATREAILNGFVGPKAFKAFKLYQELLRG